MAVCKNCGNAFEGNFCNNCGQSLTVGRINFKTLIHDVQLGLFAFDKGILYTLKQLAFRPGIAIREYIEGKRIRHFKPFSLLVILATIMGLLKFYFLPDTTADAKININGLSFSPHYFTAVYEWLNSHSAIMALVVIPFYALGSYLVFRKKGFNYSEHLVFNAYVSGLLLMLDIVTFPLVYFFNEKQGSNIINYGIAIGAFLLTVWSYIQFFSDIKLISILKKMVFVYLIYFAEIIVFGIIIASAIAIFS